MVVQFKKAIGKSNILTCIRSDGWHSWVKMHSGIEAHDLGQSAVETVLGFRNAFCGMVAKGNDIEDFELSRDRRPIEVMPKNFSNEALATEHMVNLLVIKAQNIEENFDILTPLEAILKEKNISFPKVLGSKKLLEI